LSFFMVYVSVTIRTHYHTFVYFIN
jgi:hypothetical protein